MDYKDLRSIQETYNAMYSEEVVEEGLAGMVDKATKAAQGGLERMGVKINRGPKPTARPSVKTQDTIRKNQSSMEEVDVFDIVRGHLIDEHNLSEDVALQLMTILDEEIKADILEYNAQMRADAAPKGGTVKMTATGKEPVGDKILRGIKDRVGGFLRNLNPNALKSKTNESYIKEVDGSNLPGAIPPRPTAAERQGMIKHHEAEKAKDKAKAKPTGPGSPAVMSTPPKPMRGQPSRLSAEAYTVTNADKKGNTPAYQNYLKGMKNKKTGEPLYKPAPHLKGV